MQHIFLVGAKSLGAYGGYETFIDKLTEYHQNDSDLKYHIATKANGQGANVPKSAKWIEKKRYVYHNADVFQIDIPEWLGAAQAIYYDCMALKYCIKLIKKDRIKNPIVYVMACRVGPFYNYYVKIIHKLGGKVFLNPDGHEWRRAKWIMPIRKYWKKSEELMVKYSDLIICDSLTIEEYIRRVYSVNNTTFIAYGAETRKSVIPTEEYDEWLRKKRLVDGHYYLIVGRFVPENNYEIMIREFMKSKVNKDLVIITNVDEKFLNKLEKKLKYKADKRIKFVGTVYNKELLMKIREQAYGYLHGHEVGGTNPSLLESLGKTKLNLLLDVRFNREVAEDGALYWTKNNGCLAELLNECEMIDRSELSIKAKKRIQCSYSWEYISEKYKKAWSLKEINHG